MCYYHALTCPAFIFINMFLSTFYLMFDDDTQTAPLSSLIVIHREFNPTCGYKESICLRNVDDKSRQCHVYFDSQTILEANFGSVRFSFGRLAINLRGV